MKFNPDTIRQRILDKNPTLGRESKIGVVSSFCKEQSIDERPEGGVDIIMVATTNDIDLDREVVVPEGADTSYFFKNRSIFVDHHYDFDHCIGKLRSANPMMKGGEQAGWRIRFHVPPLEKNAYAKDIITFAKDGALSSSIGYESKDAGRPDAAESLRYKQGDAVPRSIVRKWHWLETSLTMFPCNLEAAQVGLAPAEEKEFAGELMVKRFEYLRGMLGRGLIAEQTAKAFGLQSLRPVTERKRVVVDLSPPRRRVVVG